MFCSCALVLRNKKGQTAGCYVAGRFCLSHSSQYGPASDQHSIQQHDWHKSQALDHRSQSFPLDLRGASNLSVDPAHWPTQEAARPQTYSQLPQQEAYLCSPVQTNSASQLPSPPKSAWRQSLQEQPSSTSLDSRSSETTMAKKRQTVLIWDLDETLILFHSLLSGLYASNHSPEVTLISMPCCFVCLSLSQHAMCSTSTAIYY